MPQVKYKEKARTETETKEGVEVNAQEKAESRRAKEKKAERKKRIPVGIRRRSLAVDNLPAGKQARWVNDTPGRINAFLDGGYTFLRQDGTIEVDNTDPGEAHISRVVGVSKDNREMRAYLMVIDEDIYNEDQAAKQEQLDVVDDAIKHGAYNVEAADKRYVPKDRVTDAPYITVGTGYGKGYKP
jgi:hypothetical protein